MGLLHVPDVVGLTRHTSGMSNIPSAASLRMIGEDSLWATDVILSANRHSGDLASSVGLSLFPHWARIVYESHRYFGTHSASLGSPPSISNASQIARARHSVKLFDDTSRGFQGLVAWFDKYLIPAHEGAFKGRARWKPLSRFENDLGLFFQGGNLVTTTHIATYEAGIDPSLMSDPGAVVEAFGGTALSIGRVLGAIVNGLCQQPPTPTLDLQSVEASRRRDCVADEYFARRYDSHLPRGVKCALNVIECNSHVAGVLIAPTELGHEGAVFRLRLITLRHALRGLKQIVSQYGGMQRYSGMSSVVSLLSEPTAALLASRGAGRLRNIAMHYSFDASVSSTGSMSSLVDHFLPSTSYPALQQDLRQLALRTGRILREWNADVSC